jgi:hypothetical protein
VRRKEKSKVDAKIRGMGYFEDYFIKKIVYGGVFLLRYFKAEVPQVISSDPMFIDLPFF